MSFRRRRTIVFLTSLLLTSTISFFQRTEEVLLYQLLLLSTYGTSAGRQASKLDGHGPMSRAAQTGRCSRGLKWSTASRFRSKNIFSGRKCATTQLTATPATNNERTNGHKHLHEHGRVPQTYGGNTKIHKVTPEMGDLMSARAVDRIRGVGRHGEGLKCLLAGHEAVAEYTASS